MTKKDYKLIAGVLHDFTNGIIGTDDTMSFIDEFCIRLKADNPRFNAEKFKAAIYGKETTR